MSRVFFPSEYNNQSVEVVVGWDRKGAFYHLTIFDQDYNVLWDGLEHLGFCRDIRALENTLSSLVTNIPRKTINFVGECEGNVDYHWNEKTQTYDRTDNTLANGVF